MSAKRSRRLNPQAAFREAEEELRFGAKDQYIWRLSTLNERYSNGIIPADEPDLNRLEDLGYVGLYGGNGQRKITESGYSMLQRWFALKATRELRSAVQDMNESSTKINKEMLAHTRTMTKLTWFILAATILNLILLVVQLCTGR